MRLTAGFSSSSSSSIRSTVDPPPSAAAAEDILNFASFLPSFLPSFPPRVLYPISQKSDPARKDFKGQMFGGRETRARTTAAIRMTSPEKRAEAGTMTIEVDRLPKIGN